MLTSFLLTSAILLGLSNELRAQPGTIDDGCGTKSIELTPGKKSFDFPLDKQDFSDKTDCTITIKSPDGYTTTTTVEKISIEDPRSNCDEGYFRVAATKDGLNAAKKQCGSKAGSEILEASGLFYLGINMANMKTKATFTLTFETLGPNDGCGSSTLQLDPGTKSVTFPLGDQAFSKKTSCIIAVTPPDGYTTFTSIETISIPDPRSNCDEGYFQVAETVDGVVKATKRCGTKAVADILKASGKFYIQIIMVGMKTASTFTLKFVSTGPNDGCGNNAVQLNNGTQIVKFPIGDQAFSDATNCLITITPPSGQTTTTSIEKIAIEDPHATCDQGYFQVAAKTEDLGSAPKRCGTKAVSDILQAAEPFYVKVVMSGMKTAPTFELKFVSGISRIMSSGPIVTLSLLLQLTISCSM